MRENEITVISTRPTLVDGVEVILIGHDRGPENGLVVFRLSTIAAKDPDAEVPGNRNGSRVRLGLGDVLDLGAARWIVSEINDIPAERGPRAAVIPGSSGMTVRLVRQSD